MSLASAGGSGGDGGRGGWRGTGRHYLEFPLVAENDAADDAAADAAEMENVLQPEGQPSAVDRGRVEDVMRMSRVEGMDDRAIPCRDKTKMRKVAEERALVTKSKIRVKASRRRYYELTPRMPPKNNRRQVLDKANYHHNLKICIPHHPTIVDSRDIDISTEGKVSSNLNQGSFHRGGGNAGGDGGGRKRKRSESGEGGNGDDDGGGGRGDGGNGDDDGGRRGRGDGGNGDDDGGRRGRGDGGGRRKRKKKSERGEGGNGNGNGDNV